MPPECLDAEIRYLDRTLSTVAENLALDDALLAAAEAPGGPSALRLWELPGPAVVLGASCRRREEVHLAACRGELPGVVRAPDAVRGKLIVYAPRPVRVGQTAEWLARGIRDVPAPDTTIAEGHPICTVLAREPTRAGCRARLEAEAGAVLAACARPSLDIAPGGGQSNPG